MVVVDVRDVTVDVVVAIGGANGTVNVVSVLVFLVLHGLLRLVGLVLLMWL